jgi:hypothetical protein
LSEIRSQFVLGASCSSRAIAWWGQGYGGFSHVDAVLSDGTLAGARSDIIRPLGGGPAIPAGCQIRPANYEKWTRVMVMSRQVDDGTAQMWDQFFRTRAGKIKYDKGDILGFIIGKDRATPGRWICSAWNADGAQTLDLLPSICLPLTQITPNTLSAIYSATGWLIVS